MRRATRLLMLAAVFCGVARGTLGQHALDLSAVGAFAGYAGGGYSQPVAPFSQGGTIETWVFAEPISTGETRIIASCENDYWLYFLDDGSLGVRMELGAGNHQVYGTAPGLLALGEWQHVAFTYDQSIARFYLNGTLVADAPTSGGPIWGAQTIQFGCWSHAPNDVHFLFMRGKLDNSRVWSTVRSEAEIQATMQQEGVSAPGLTASWTWDESDLDTIASVTCPLSPAAGFAAPGPLDVVGEWIDLGLGLAGTSGTPVCSGVGFLMGGDPVEVLVANARPLAFSWLVLGLANISAPFKGGVIVPSPDLPLPFVTNGAGEAALSAMWPAGVPSSATFYAQWWIQDPAGPKGFAASNGLAGTTP